MEMDRPRSEFESDKSSPDEMEQLVLPGLGDTAEHVRDDVEALAAPPPFPCLVLLRETVRQDGHGAGGRVEHPGYAVVRPDEAEIGRASCRERVSECV